MFAGRKTAPTFAVDADSIDPAVFGLASYVQPNASTARVSRREAIQLDPVKRCRDLIATTLGGLPIDVFGPDKQPSTSTLLDQPERNVPRSVTYSRTFEDMLFEGVAWWRILEFGWHGFPTKVKRLDPRKVTVNEDTDTVYVNGKAVPNTELIRFDSPNDGLLIAGARPIRRFMNLTNAADAYSNGAPPVDYFTPADGSDPADEEDDDEVTKILDAWSEARRARRTAYVPAALKYNIAGWSPEQLELGDSQDKAVVGIARAAGVDPEELGVSTTSRTYQNQFDRRKAFLDFTLGGYINAFQDRLSMGDVTPRGYLVRLNLDAFLRSDTKTRFETYKVGLEVGAIDAAEIRDLEDKPPLANPPKPQEAKVSADQPVEVIFDSGPAIRLDSPHAAALFEVDAEKRTIRGLAVPYGKVAASGGQKWRFSKGSLTWGDVSRVKLWVQHDPKRAIGVAAALDDTDEGLVATFKVARGEEGDRALALAEDGVLDGLSVGIAMGGKYRRTKDGINDAVSAPVMEISLTPAPAFDDARVHAVAASATHQGEKMTPEQRARFDALLAKANRSTDEETEFVTLSALAADEEDGTDFGSVTNAIKAGFASLASIGGREIVNPTDGLEVNEEAPYRFDGIAGKHSFVEDLRSANFGDSEAKQRIDVFMNETFAVSSTNVSSLNPTQNRPDLYVPHLPYTRPLWDAVTTGSIEDKTPFTIPKFSSSSGLVAAHTEGTEPTPGAFAATTQTVTPGAVSGKIEINREVLDQGGSPQADQIIWNEMLNAYYEAIEARIATLLGTIATAEINLASAVDSALVVAITNYLAGLQFVRGGNRFTKFVADGKLFPALVAAKDGANRPLLPVSGPSNTQGDTSAAFDRVSIGAQEIRAAWALGSANASKSYLFVPSSVYAWASAPKRFQFEYQVKSVDIAIWGYGAEAVTRDSDVQPVDYTTADS